MTAVDTTPAATPAAGDAGECAVPASLRERKKLATRRTLRRVAIDLVAERGFARVTVEDIAEAADVSPRTFFNYFPTKEAAVFGADPDRLDRIRAGIVSAAPGQDAHAALREVLAADARARAAQLAELGGDPADVAAPDEVGQRRPGPARGPGRAHGPDRAGHRRRAGRAAGHRPRPRSVPVLLAAAATAVLRADADLLGQFRRRGSAGRHHRPGLRGAGRRPARELRAAHRRPTPRDARRKGNHPDEHRRPPPSPGQSSPATRCRT